MQPGEMTVSGMQTTHSPRPSGAALLQSQSQTEHQEMTAARVQTTHSPRRSAWQSETEHQNAGPREGCIPGAGSQEGLDNHTPPVDNPSGRSRRSENANDAIPLGLVLPQARAEHALQECREVQLGIVVGPPAATNTKDKGINTSVIVSCATWQGLGPFLLFYAVALVGVIPRCTVLLASHALPQTPASQAVTGFLDIWQSCAVSANAFSDFSSGGNVYKVLIGSDQVFFGLGMTLTGVGALHLTFPDASQSRHGAWRLGMTASLLFLVWSFHFVLILSTLLADNVSLAALDGLEWMPTHFALATFASVCVGYVYVAMAFSSNLWRYFVNLDLDALSSIRRKLYVVVAMVGTAAVIWRIASLLYFFEALFASKVSSVMAASCFFRIINFFGRWLVNRDTSLPVHVANMLSLLLLSFAFVAMRRIILDASNQNPLVLLVNCLKLASVEVVSRSLAYSMHIIMISCDMQNLNGLTLVGLVDLHTAVQRRVDGITSYMFVDQFVEIFVFILITSQDLSAPIWSHIRVWRSVEAWSARFPSILAEGAVQMSVEFLVDLLIWRLCFQRLAWDMPQITRRIFHKPRSVAVFTMGLMLMHSLNFFPTCITCSWPVHCLVFTECLFDGKVMINGKNACTQTIANWTNYAEIAVQEMTSRTQVEISPEQLGCGRQGVNCFGLETVSK